MGGEDDCVVWTEGVSVMVYLKICFETEETVEKPQSLSAVVAICKAESEGQFKKKVTLQRHCLNENLPHSWIGRSVITDLSFHTWPPRSPDLTPCDFFLWGYIKDVVYVPPLPNDIQELRQRIIAAVATINRDMLERVWTEMDYRIDVCRVTRDSHIECL
jgi:hypothetical protein